MIQKIKNKNIKHNAFTLIEMIIVLIVMWIMLMVTLFLSSDQIQKVKDKTVKETILAEMQTRYSKNLWSSSFAWTMYGHLDVEFSGWNNKISFSYYTWDNEEPFLINDLTDNFKIRYITLNYNEQSSDVPKSEIVNLRYTPYKISCEIWEENENVVIITRVNDSRDYCFEIKKQNCRLMEISEEKCKDIKNKAHLD